MAQMEDLQMTLITKVMFKHSRNHRHRHSHSNSNELKVLQSEMQELQVLRPVMLDKTDGLSNKSMYTYYSFIFLSARKKNRIDHHTHLRVDMRVALILFASTARINGYPCLSSSDMLYLLIQR